jgi:hypothetical protein
MTSVLLREHAFHLPVVNRQAQGVLGMTGVLRMTGVLKVAGVLERAGRAASGQGAIVRLLSGGVLAAVLAGVLVVPAAEFVLETNYAETRPLERVARDGYLTLLSWFRPASGTGSLESSQLYLGMVPLALAFAGLAFGRRREVLPLATLALLAVLVAAGTHGPLFGALYHWLPGFRIVYLPARLGVVAAFAVACLAALGAQRLATGPWAARHTALVAALVAALPVVVLLQFWHSEGYDSFRRLLTNVGRFTGGPFLTREQQAHYAAFGLLALGALVLARRLPARWALAPVVALTAADLTLAQARALPRAFDPVAWYAPAIEAGRELARDLGGERLAGLQWHGDQHFLNDFPASSLPGLLPPNLALLAGVRDAQAYNPLLLRRAVEYFAEINGGERDDHWLWIKRYDAPGIGHLDAGGVDALAVRRVLAAGGEWRVTNQLLAEGIRLPAHTSHVIVVPEGPVEVGRLRIVSYLGEATELAQGTPAIEVTLAGASITPGGGEVELRFVLRAGVETAEWAYGRPDVRASVRHRQAPVALETRLVNAAAGTFSVYEYLATFELPEPIAIRAVRASAPPGWAAQAPGATAYIQGLWLEPPDDGSARPAPIGLDRPMTQPRLTIEGGGAVLLDDQPERVTARVSAPGAGTLVLADAYYPGWQAAVDGAAQAIVPVDGLFRGVRVPPGEHDVAFTYRPGSLRAGLALSAAGLLATAALALAGRGRRLALRSERAGRSRRRPGPPPPAR